MTQSQKAKPKRGTQVKAFQPVFDKLRLFAFNPLDLRVHGLNLGLGAFGAGNSTLSGFTLFRCSSGLWRLLNLLTWKVWVYVPGTSTRMLLFCAAGAMVLIGHS